MRRRDGARDRTGAFSAARGLRTAWARTPGALGDRARCDRRAAAGSGRGCVRGAQQGTKEGGGDDGDGRAGDAAGCHDAGAGDDTDAHPDDTGGKVPPIAKTPVLPTKAVTPPVTTPPPRRPADGRDDGRTENLDYQQSKGTTRERPEALLLDTDAACDVQPLQLPGERVRGPQPDDRRRHRHRLERAGEPVDAPAMAEGVAIDLKSAKKLSAVKLVTSTPGMTLQVYGANTQTAPASITDKAWVPISHSLTIRKRRARVALQSPGQDLQVHRRVDQRSASNPAVGTPEAPGKVTLNEIEVFPDGLSAAGTGPAGYAPRHPPGQPRCSARGGTARAPARPGFRRRRGAAGRARARAPDFVEERRDLVRRGAPGGSGSSTSESASISFAFGISDASIPASENGCTGSRPCPRISAGVSNVRRSSRCGAERPKKRPCISAPLGPGSWRTMSSITFV